MIRHPITCCRSILKSERDDDGTGGRFKELRSPEFIQGGTATEKAAAIWNGVNGMVQEQFQMIGNAKVCKVLRLEDVSVASIRGLFDFLELKGFDADKVNDLIHDASHDVRHSHIGHPANRRKDATLEELSTIAKFCEPLAKQYGYDTDVEMALQK